MHDECFLRHLFRRRSMCAISERSDEHCGQEDCRKQGVGYLQTPFLERRSGLWRLWRLCLTLARSVPVWRQGEAGGKGKSGDGWRRAIKAGRRQPRAGRACLFFFFLKNLCGGEWRLVCPRECHSFCWPGAQHKQAIPTMSPFGNMSSGKKKRK